MIEESRVQSIRKYARNQKDEDEIVGYFYNLKY